jgi:hypothetical protein
MATSPHRPFVAIDDLRGLVEHDEEEWRFYEPSMRERDGTVYLLARHGLDRKLIGVTEADRIPFEHEKEIEHASHTVFVCPCSPENARLLREHFAWTAPEPLGTTPAIGCGDRLGLATPGHIRACEALEAQPVLAQQSIREMERTGRSPQEVMDDVTWAVFQEGYTGGFGADADHLKTPEDIDRCFAAGYTMYTIDPSDHVDNEADHLGRDELERRFEALPWDTLNTTPEAYLAHYTDEPIVLERDAGRLEITFSEEELKRAAVKYSAAVANTNTLADHLAARYETNRPDAEYDLEMSVDETEQPTHPREHYFVAAELERLGVMVTSLAPRFVGDFEKGIDFIGDPDAFEKSLTKHVIILQACGGYKLSVHSGSDKFTVFPILGRQAGPNVHLKTAGTSYLEALRIPARHAPDVFREIVRYAFGRFETDRKTYHVSTDLSAIPDPDDLDDDELEAAYLDENNGRQLLHITYGSVLTATEDGEWRFKDRFFTLLHEHEGEHFDALEEHFRHHIESVGTIGQ